MKAAILTQQQAFGLIGGKIPPGLKLILPSKQRWEIAIIVRECGHLNGHFAKSAEKHVDDNTKRSALLRALSELYAAVCNEDYQGALEQSGVNCKVAYDFEYEGGKHKLWELKPNNKDRLYFYPLKDGLPNGKKVIFLLLAYHKKDQKTPKEISEACKEEIKLILQARGKIKVCEDKNVAKK